MSPKRRERDPRRVPHLGISDPISHVKVVPAEDPNDWAHRKFGAEIAEHAERQAEREAEHAAEKEKTR